MKEAADIIALYDRNAADWDADRGRLAPGAVPLERPWLERFTDLLPALGASWISAAGPAIPWRVT